ncbi:hypothetical protein [Algoriphagus sp. CAU 1675]|uniref:hypothetical protein n=1 Tax=Algoriphagus sp. CAU 1675 TaxID=3032597 RepID=UPI0023DB4FBB|nr:hypothetical protein [Algoriphagus sp. CAU 1675]
MCRVELVVIVGKALRDFRFFRFRKAVRKWLSAELASVIQPFLGLEKEKKSILNEKQGFRIILAGWKKRPGPKAFPTRIPALRGQFPPEIV